MSLRYTTGTPGLSLSLRLESLQRRQESPSLILFAGEVGIRDGTGVMLPAEVYIGASGKPHKLKVAQYNTRVEWHLTIGQYPICPALPGYGFRFGLTRSFMPEDMGMRLAAVLWAQAWAVICEQAKATTGALSVEPDHIAVYYDGIEMPLPEARKHYEEDRLLALGRIQRNGGGTQAAYENWPLVDLKAYAHSLEENYDSNHESPDGAEAEE